MDQVLVTFINSVAVKRQDFVSPGNRDLSNVLSNPTPSEHSLTLSRMNSLAVNLVPSWGGLL
jgi:hypothetical protein